MREGCWLHTRGGDRRLGSWLRRQFGPRNVVERHNVRGQHYGN
jgi:hypothetical protein